MVGYKLSLASCPGWMYLGTEPQEVADALRNELESNEGLSVDEIEEMTIEAFEITQEEIDKMPEFQGW